MLVLGIESSCDETAVAVMRQDADAGSCHILSHVIFSQVKEHAAYGGIVPEVAARAHIFHIRQLVSECVSQANISLQDLSLIAVTTGPGLVGSLTVGLMVAKGLAFALNIPLIGVNHLVAHVLAPMITQPSLSFPFAARAG